MRDRVPGADASEPFCPENWEAHCRRVTKDMAAHASRFSTPISLSLNYDRTGKHLGTGTYHDMLGVKLLLSCAHVLNQLEKNRLAHKLLGHDRYVLMDGAIAEVAWPIDAAAASISSFARDDIRHTSGALPLTRMAMVHDPAPFELLFVYGYAYENAQFVCDELRADGTAYLCREATLPIHPKVDPRFHFALEYRRDVAIQAFGERGLPDPQSMSGSLVWNTRFVECALAQKEWTQRSRLSRGSSGPGQMNNASWPRA